ncbi:hypothetical protein KIN20_012589 [Parelaphostrongylus tenuis]|uniref:Uncharacterized protein n=1 Tax=Parelaphostrongylus tenuis TaxID=148309 RepID=A0AAD5QLY4_PARTN|nr:hypothetical protein KIN20_012589 [Parelaphostrongylus tenuis]
MFDSQLIRSNSAASRTWRFNVTGFSLPVAMAFSTDPAARAQVPQISPNSGSAEAFVKRLVIQGVLDVLEQQGRAAGLPDFVITTILSQLGINVLYTPLPCPKVSVNPSGNSKYSTFSIHYKDYTQFVLSSQRFFESI